MSGLPVRPVASIHVEGLRNRRWHLGSCIGNDGKAPTCGPSRRRFSCGVETMAARAAGILKALSDHSLLQATRRRVLSDI